MPSIQLPDGRHEHTFSASWISSFATCPEQARQRYYKISPYTANDYLALGSALHRGIEVALQAKIDGAAFRLTEAGVEAHAKLEQIEAEPGFEYKKWTYDSVRIQLDEHLVTFFDEVYPVAQPISVEQEFNLLLHEDAFRVIRVRGFIDYRDVGLGTVDWKTAGAPHKTWEKERYEKQPSVYPWAVTQLTGEPCDSMRYVVFVHGKKPQTYVVERNPGHIEWFKRQALAAARLIEANLSIWPMVDTTWVCSPKWCDAWATCRGQFLGENPW